MLEHLTRPLVFYLYITYNACAVNKYVGKIQTMAKSPSLGVRIQLETKDALERAAKDDMRSVSSLVEKILTDWLRDKGYLGK